MSLLNNEKQRMFYIQYDSFLVNLILNRASVITLRALEAT